MCEIFEMLNNSYQPTHVVTAITYGGNAHFVFEKKIDIDDVIDEIGGNLTAKYKMAVFEIEGSFSLDNNEVTSYLSNVSNIKVRYRVSNVVLSLLSLCFRSIQISSLRSSRLTSRKQFRSIRTFQQTSETRKTNTNTPALCTLSLFRSKW